MKLRIRGNSLRIRLTKSEVDKLSQEGYLEETTAFATGTLTYALQAKTGIAGLDADFAGGKITMYVPAEIPAVWVSNEVVGYDNTVNTPNGGLYLLLEKDFVCIDAPPTEDQSDNYENPHMVC
jgi:hypothetical protein